MVHTTEIAMVETNQPYHVSFFQYGFRILNCIAQAILSGITLYFLVVVVGLIPVNNEFAPTPDGIEIFLVSSAIHADIVLPLKTDTINWRADFSAECFSGDTSEATHVAVGWGDKEFFVATRRWSDLRASIVAKALFFPSETCLHVTLTRADTLPDDARTVTISTQQYTDLVQFINSTFQHDENGAKIQVPNTSYTPNDAFFEAQGSYHCLNTCNVWVGRVAQSAGIRAGWLTPMPKTVFLYVPD